MKQKLQGRAAWIYRKVLRHPLLDVFLREHAGDQGVLETGWGYRPSGRAAKKKGGRLLLLEDAFVRSLRPGNRGPVYGMIADSRGIHYDVNGESDLLVALETGEPTGWMRRKVPEDTGELMRLFRETGSSKYNWFPGEYRPGGLPVEPGVLVVDQSRGDAAIVHGGLDPRAFDRMLRDALDGSGGSPVYVRAHPDHLYRKKHSCFSESILSDPRVKLLPPDLSPAQCFSFCHTVMVGSSLMGMEALVHGVKVVTYGMPFFAGRGLTEDRGAVPARSSSDLTKLFRMAYQQYGHYYDPDTLEPCELGDILRHIALQKEYFRRNSGHSVTAGFSQWKRNIVPGYLRSPAGTLSHANSLEEAAAAKADKLMVWGRKTEIPAELSPVAVRVEDGFIRSKGLGAAFNFPYSWVLDETGIYFDAGAPSDLENLLNRGFAEADLQEARELIRVLREKRLSKYNLAGESVSFDRTRVGDRKVILVPGQVEADASIGFGSPEVKSNIELLRRVRVAEPDAFIIFKAHPDLVAGARHGNVMPPGFTESSDMAVTEGNVLDWLDVCDEVHTMTSTVGFESLIREVPVVTYGTPFYAAWGLTTDRLACPRRQRELTLEELVCGALIKYPRYLNPATGEFTTALKVTRLLTSDAVAGDVRAWHLRMVSILKKLWVKSARKKSQA